MPLNERCLSSTFHGYDVKSASEKLATTLVEAAAAGPPFSAFVSCVSTVCMRINSL